MEAFDVSDRSRGDFSPQTSSRPPIRFLPLSLRAEGAAMAAVGSDVTDLKLHSCIGFTGERRCLTDARGCRL